MPESRGSSFEASLPLIHDPDSSSGRGALPDDDAPTEIKSMPIEAPIDPELPNLADRELLGTTLDHFELLDCIGVGGMGRVYRARDNRLDRLVALKVLAPDLAKDGEICRRFEQEAKAAARLDDRHFARVYFFGEDKGLKYIAMEFVEGENLRRKIQLSGRLDFTTVLNIGLQIARGLAHAASCGVVHRDIKPSNIVITPTGTAKLVDMGLARSFFQSSSPASELTHAGVTLGTFDYISPEQARDPRDADTRSDIYSLGCTLYHALTGRPPFPEGTALQKLLQHQSDSVTDPRRLVADLPDPVNAVLMKMLAKNPKDRYQSPGELIHDLRAVSRLLEIPLPDEPGYVGEVGVGQTVWERQLVWLVPMILFLASIAGYSFVFQGKTIPPDTSPNVASALPLSPPPPVPAATIKTAPVVPDAPPAASISSSSKGETVRVGRPRDVLPTDDLHQAVMNAEDGEELILHGNHYDIQFTQSGDKLLSGVIIDKNLTLVGEGTDEAGMTTIEIDDNRDGKDGFSDLSLFDIQGANVAFKNLRLRVRCSREAPAGINTVAVEDGSLHLDNCNLILDGSPKEGATTPCAMVKANSYDLSRPSKIVAHRCYFGGGQDCFRLGGRGDIQVELVNCAFQEFEETFDIGGPGKTSCKLDHVSLFAGGPVIKLPQLGRATFQVADSVFSRLRGSSAPLIQVIGDDSPQIVPWWRGSRNLYHGFDKGLLEVANAPKAQLLDELREWGIDEGEASQEMQHSLWPWALVDPKKPPFGNREIEKNAVRVFRLKENSPARKLAEDGGPIGVRISPTGNIYSSDSLAEELALDSPPKILASPEPLALPSPTTTKVEAKPAEVPTTLYVDPSAQIGTERGVFRQLSNACNEVAAGGTAVIILRTNETVEVADVKLSGQKLTIRPEKDFHPTIRLRSPLSGESQPPAMFQLSARARLRIEEVPIIVDSSGWTASNTTEDIVRAAFECDQECSVELENLAVQLGKGSRTRSMTLFQAKAPFAPLFMGVFGTNQTEPSNLTLRRCNVRTLTGLLAAEPSAYWNAVVEDCFVAAEGIVLSVEGKSNGGGKQANKFVTRHTTYLLQDSLAAIEVSGRMPDPPRRLEIDSTECAYIGSGRGAPLTRCIGDLDPRAQKDSIPWMGNVNFFAGYTVYFHASGASSVGMGTSTVPNDMDKDVWLSHFGLLGENYFFGKNEVGSFGIDPIWEQRIPTAADLRGLDCPINFTDSVGVSPFLLPPNIR